MSLKQMFNMIPFIMVVCMSGCANPTQEMWGSNLVWAERFSNYLSREKKEMMSTEWLVALIGKPDTKISVLKFPELLEAERRDAAMQRIWRVYAENKGVALATSDWRRSIEFSKCEVWLYDERAHFAWPACKVVGFDACVFLVKDSKVMAALGAPRAYLGLKPPK